MGELQDLYTYYYYCSSRYVVVASYLVGSPLLLEDLRAHETLSASIRAINSRTLQVSDIPAVQEVRGAKLSYFSGPLSPSIWDHCKFSSRSGDRSYAGWTEWKGRRGRRGSGNAKSMEASSSEDGVVLGKCERPRHLQLFRVPRRESGSHFLPPRCPRKANQAGNPLNLDALSPSEWDHLS